MMSVLVAPLALLIAPAKPVEWYGPVTVSFAAYFDGNAYDPDQNDVRVKFVREKGKSVERLAYFDDGKWKAVLLAPEPGKYKASLIRNGRATLAPVSIEIKPSQKQKDGFIRRDTKSVNRFRFDSQAMYYPVGHNLAWPGYGVEFAKQIPQMKEAGLNWARIWACAWSDYNPWWPNDKSSKDVLWNKALSNWNNTINLCEQNGVHFQFVLFHHGQFSSTVNPNWPDHPWNAKNGGYLDKPDDFFTNPEAIKRSKMWFRYAVARWGHSPSIMAWELFNEVEWCDAFRNNIKSVIDWHSQMADFIRSIDPYKHLITSSSSMAHPEMYAKLDYYQPHTYPPDIVGAVTQEKQPGDKPLFFGEFGAMNNAEKYEKKTIRDGLYAGMLANHAGTAMYWSWDRIPRLGLYKDLKTASEIIKVSRLADHPKAKMHTPSVTTNGFGVTSFTPGRGWATTEKFVFNLPEDANTSNTGLVAGYFQSQTGGHKEMCPEPLTFKFSAPGDGEFRVRLTNVARRGAHVRLWLDGSIVDELKVEPSNRDQMANKQLKAAHKKGEHTVKLENIGEDWAVIASIEVSPLGPQASALALGEPDWLLMRIVSNEDAALPVQASIGKLSLKDGNYQATVWNLNLGTKKALQVSVKGGKILGSLNLTDHDAIIWLSKPKK